jgi:hypothetical protein
VPPAFSAYNAYGTLTNSVEPILSRFVPPVGSYSISRYLLPVDHGIDEKLPAITVPSPIFTVNKPN